MDLFSEAEKAQFSSYIDDIHDTFKMTILYFKEQDVLTLSSNQNFNYVYDENQSGVTKTTQIHSGTFDARVQYFDPVKIRMSQQYPVGNLPVIMDKTYARIKLKKDDYDAIFNGIVKIKMDGLTFEILNVPQMHGLFDNNYVSVLVSSVK